MYGSIPVLLNLLKSHFADTDISFKKYWKKEFDEKDDPYDENYFGNDFYDSNFHKKTESVDSDKQTLL
jgi:hypothetical protein